MTFLNSKRWYNDALTRWFGLVLVFVACTEIVMPGFLGVAVPMSGGGFWEYFFLGLTMSFDDFCVHDGILIEDVGILMIACMCEPVPANEFDHPGSPVPQRAMFVDS
jgi:hypothetical protein